MRTTVASAPMSSSSRSNAPEPVSSAEMRRAAPSWAKRGARELLWRIREDADGRPLANQGLQARARRRVATQVCRRVILAEPLEEDAPVAGARLVECPRRLPAVGGQRVRIDVQHGASRLEPRAPERARVAEGVELDRDRALGRHASRRVRTVCQRTTPTTTPTASSATSSGEPTRPGTNDWCTSSLIAYSVPERDCESGSPGRPDEERAEDGVFGRVRDLAQDEVPAAESGAEVGNRREGEDDRRPGDDGQPQARERPGHRPMIGSPAIRSTVREPGANPGRSRRCKGRSSPATKPLAQAGKAAREGAPSQKTCRAPHNRTPRGREDSGASFVRPPRRSGARRAGSRRLGRVRRRDRPRRVPRHRHRLQREGHGRQAADPHRVALADGDRDALRHRRGLAGRRRRRPVRLPEVGSADLALGLHAERRGDRGVPARPRRHRVRPEGPLRRTRPSRDHRAPPGRRQELQGRLPADPATRPRHRSRVASNAADRVDEVADLRRSSPTPRRHAVA